MLLLDGMDAAAARVLTGRCALLSDSGNSPKLVGVAASSTYAAVGSVLHDNSCAGHVMVVRQTVDKGTKCDTLSAAAVGGTQPCITFKSCGLDGGLPSSPCTIEPQVAAATLLLVLSSKPRNSTDCNPPPKGHKHGSAYTHQGKAVLDTHLCDACGWCDVHNKVTGLQLFHIECLGAAALQVGCQVQRAGSSVAQQPAAMHGTRRA